MPPYRVAVLSDLHLEFEPYTAPFPAADLVVLAGDTNVKGRGVAWAARHAKGRPVVYVPGNHEAYGEKLPRLTAKMRAEGAPLDVHVLDCEARFMGPLRVLGATLWTDFNWLGTPEESMALAGGPDGMTDYRRIRVAPTYRKLFPSMTVRWHREAVRWLTDQLQTPWAGPTLVVTHHAPHPAGCDPTTLSDPLTPAYVSDLGALVAQGGATAWVHGHTHWAHDTMVGETRLVSNPRGYPEDGFPGFREDFVLEF